MRTSLIHSRTSFWGRSLAAAMLLILLLAALPASTALAAETIPFHASTATVSGGTTWLNPTYVFQSDNAYASASVNKTLRLTNFNIIGLANDSIINGIAVGVEGYTAGGRQVNVQLSGDNGATWSTGYTTDLQTTDSVRTLGGPSTLWGLSWTAASFANATFAVRVTPVGVRTSGTVYVDQVTVTIYYTANGIPITVKADPQAKHYGYPEPTYTYQVTSGSLLPGDSFTGVLDREPGEQLGPHMITRGSLDAAGYIITYEPDYLTIDRAPLTITARPYWKLSSDPDITTFGALYTGFVLGETEAVLTTPPTCALPIGTDQTVPGTYEITCSGATADNYDISYAPGTLTVKSTNNVATDLTITPAVVQENHLAGYTVGTVSSNDPDVDDPFTYSFCGGADDSKFTLSGTTLKTAAKFDFETKSSYSICLKVDDGYHGIYQEDAMLIAVADLPETFRSVALLDGWILESGETTNTGGTMNSLAGSFRLGDDAANKQYRAILNFGTGTLPDKAVITKMTLKIKGYGLPVGTNPFLTHGKINVDNKKGFFGTSAALQLTDFNATATKATWFRIENTPVSGWYSATLTSANIMLVNRTGPTQLRLRFGIDDNHDFGADYLSFYSGNATFLNRPVLELQYYLP